MMSGIAILLILAIAFLWSTQGLFSSLVHLILTILAGAVAFILWEPMASVLLGRMPDQAWGVSLMVPFGLALLGLRTVFDKLVPGNLSFHNLVDKIGGGILGFFSGVLTVGILVLGLQMTGLPSLWDYQAYELDASGEPKRLQSLTIPVDAYAADFFGYISGGAMAPILSEKTLPRYHPNLAREASFYHQSAFWKSGASSGRRAIHPNSVKLAANAKLNILSEAPASLKDQLKADGKSLVVIGVETAVQPGEGTMGTGDGDGILRIARNQIELVSEGSTAGIVTTYPVGYIQGGVYKPFEDFAWSGTSSSVTHHWVFKVPTGAKPRFLYMKRARLDLSDEKTNSDAAVVEGLLTFGAETAVKPGENTQPTPVKPGNNQIAVVSAALPMMLNRNRLTHPSINAPGNVLISGTFTVRQHDDDRFIGNDLQVNSINHDPSARIVRVNLGVKQGQSIFGKAVQLANFATQAPILKSTTGDTYYAIGWTAYASPELTFSIDPSKPLRALVEIPSASFSDKHEICLYFQVEVGKTIEFFQLGVSDLNKWDLNLPVK